MKKTLFFLFTTIVVNTSFSQIDSTYYLKCVKILKKYPKSRIKASDLYNASLKTYEKHNIVVPAELAIAQAIVETSLGNSGVGKSRNNPYSINSRKGYKRYKLISDGVLEYYDMMARNYLRCRSTEQLLQNFKNCKGGKYATSNKYLPYLRKIYYEIKKISDS